MPRGVRRSTEAKNNPVVVTKTIEAMEMDVGQQEDRVLKSTGPAEQALDKVKLVANTDKPVDEEKMAMLAFMAQPITVQIHTTTNKNDEQVFEFIVNGRPYFFRRGEQKTVPRFVVDRLARCKPTTYTDREVINEDGIKDIVYTPHVGVRYPFSVIHDPHPRGPDWLRHTLAEQ